METLGEADAVATLIPGPVCNPLETLTSTPDAAVCMPPTSIAGFMSTGPYLADTTVMARAGRVSLRRQTGAPTATNSALSSKLATTFISGISQLVRSARFNTSTCISTASANRVRCYLYKSIRIRKSPGEQTWARRLFTPGIVVAYC